MPLHHAVLLRRIWCGEVPLHAVILAVAGEFDEVNSSTLHLSSSLELLIAAATSLSAVRSASHIKQLAEEIAMPAGITGAMRPHRVAMDEVEDVVHVVFRLG